MLSSFEGAMLARHLRRCADCRAFAAAAEAQTSLLRAASLEVPAPVEVRVRVRRPVRHVGRVAVPAAAAVAAVAAAFALVSPGGHATQSAVRVGTDVTSQSSLDALTNFAGGTQNLGVQRRLVRRPKVDEGIRGVYGLPT
jgi:predicted anti-sigma-YlaC factor YlaD